MQDTIEKREVDNMVLYQVASERFNVMHQQTQTAINISTVSILAFFTAIGAVFSSMANTTNTQYKIFADSFIILASFLAIATSIVCIEILNRCAGVLRDYEKVLTEFENNNTLSFKPHVEFSNIWETQFKRYEPYKATCSLLIVSIGLYTIIFVVAARNFVALGAFL